MWGTPTHYSPELIQKAYGPQSDMWSLGCMLYEMLTGVEAFPSYVIIILLLSSLSTILLLVFISSVDMSKLLFCYYHFKCGLREYLAGLRYHSVTIITTSKLDNFPHISFFRSFMS